MRLANFTTAWLSVVFVFAFALLSVGDARADWSLLGKSVTLSGKLKTETRNVSGFTGVSLGTVGLVEIVQGDSEGVTVEADENILPYILTNVDRGSLQIRLDKVARTDGNLRLKIVVRAININNLAVGGSGTIRAARLQTTNLNASVGGSGNISIEGLAVKQLSTAIGGSGTFTASGAAEAFDISIGGSGMVRSKALMAEKVSVSVAGSGSTVVSARDALSVSIAGSGSVDYYGDPKLSVSKAGSGRVTRLGAQL